MEGQLHHCIVCARTCCWRLCHLPDSLRWGSLGPCGERMAPEPADPMYTLQELYSQVSCGFLSLCCLVADKLA